MRAHRERAAIAACLAMASAVSAGCAEPIGPCDPGVARTVVYDQASGDPAFEGQAAMIHSCGGGGFCHSPGIAAEARRGAPAGLDYDLQLASNSDRTEPESTERLRAMHARAFRDRRVIWDQVASGRMPIPGAVAEEVTEAAPRFVRLNPATGERTPTPGLETDVGREALRNWLACGLPVVERTRPPADGEEAPEPVGFVVASQEEPLEPNWPDIYERLVVPRCASRVCHGAEVAGGLDLRDQDATLNRLLEGTAAGEDCAPTGIAWLVREEPEASLLFQKLSGVDSAGEPVCGDRMPDSGTRLSEESLASVRRWILEGADP